MDVFIVQNSEPSRRDAEARLPQQARCVSYVSSAAAVDDGTAVKAELSVGWKITHSRSGKLWTNPKRLPRADPLTSGRMPQPVFNSIHRLVWRSLAPDGIRSRDKSPSPILETFGATTVNPEAGSMGNCATEGEWSRPGDRQRHYDRG
jgi:hypothetical protein